jgi:hypothetical protein
LIKETIMDLDILSPEFLEMAAKAKELSEKRTAAVEEFKALWLKHKEDLARLDAEVAAVKEEYVKAATAAKKKDKKEPVAEGE